MVWTHATDGKRNNMESTGKKKSRLDEQNNAIDGQENTYESLME